MIIVGIHLDITSRHFGLIGAEKLSKKQRLSKYRNFVYDVGSLKTDNGKRIDPQIVATEAEKQFSLTSTDRFLSRTRYFTDSGIIGSKEFVRQFWLQLKAEEDNPDKQPVRVLGLAGMFSLKRLSENDGI
jgi:putative transposase